MDVPEGEVVSDIKIWDVRYFPELQSTFPDCFEYLLKQKPTVRWMIAFSGTGSKKQFTFNEYALWTLGGLGGIFGESSRYSFHLSTT